MRTKMQAVVISALSAGLLLTAGAYAMAGAHTWDFVEVFRNADGSVWFIEMREPGPAGTENNVGGLPVASLAVPADSFPICISGEPMTPPNPPNPCGVSGNTATKRMLFGNPGYRELAAAQGGPPADQIVSTNAFFNVTGDTLRYNTGSPTYDTWAIPGTVPTDGVTSLKRAGQPAEPPLTNSPTNYVGGTGMVNASSLPPSVVPDRATAGTPMTVEKLTADGSDLRLSFDVNTCVLNNNHNIIFGERSDLPTLVGGTFALAGGVCGIGAAPPYTWTPTPNASDGSGLIWWLIVVSNETTVEGSWGESSAGAERVGPGLGGGSSGECLVTSKSLSNTCGS